MQRWTTKWAGLVVGLLVLIALVAILSSSLDLLFEVAGHSPAYAGGFALGATGLLLTFLMFKGFSEKGGEPGHNGDLLFQYAYHDSLTRLPNRLLLNDRLTVQAAAIRRTNISVALLMIDLDGFKEINDSLGHLAGDDLLVLVAERIRETCREIDTVARLGGDEFVVLQAVEEKGQAAALANRIIQALSQPFSITKGEVRIGCSIGITLTQRPDVRLEELIDEADFALYQSKKSGGNSVNFYQRHFEVLAHAGQDFETELAAALGNGNLGSLYREQFDRDGNSTGLEASFDWPHPLLHQTGLRPILSSLQHRELGRALAHRFLETVAAEYLRLRPRELTINMPSLQYTERHLIDALCANEYKLVGADTRCFLAFEWEDLGHVGGRAPALFEALERHGYGLVIDLDEISSASLRGLARLRPDRIRINRGTVAKVLDSLQAALTVREICEVAAPKGITVVADGVETIAQRAMLMEAGCARFQGPLWGTPRAAREWGWSETSAEVSKAVAG